MRYTVRYATIRPELTGKWYGEAWTQADTLEIAHFRPESSDHRPQTYARLLYDEDGLFGIFLVKDRYVRCVHTGYMNAVYKDSCVEFFVQPKLEVRDWRLEIGNPTSSIQHPTSNSDRGYFNFEFNCGGSLLCFYIVDPTREPGGFKDFTPLPEEDGKQVAIYHSTPQIVEPEITVPTEWLLEFFIPFALLEKYVGPVGHVCDQEWRANLYKCADDTSHPHWASWAPIDELNFHLPRCFGAIRFDDRRGRF
ncbi:MAG: hypothetical protein FJ014_01170 [Chloroflexi bacterium]|nr:hypothetical protein [Chloroflexota bacterium]